VGFEAGPETETEAPAVAAAAAAAVDTSRGAIANGSDKSSLNNEDDALDAVLVVTAPDGRALRVAVVVAAASGRSTGFGSAGAETVVWAG